MIRTAVTEKAFKVCEYAHRGQKDGGGMPYVYHPVHVAEKMTDETTTAVALLHDVIEDSSVTIEDLIDVGFSMRIVNAVTALTKARDEDYFDYILRVKTNSDAVKVKLADLEHNCDLSRLKTVTDKDILRTEKYKQAKKILQEKNVSCKSSVAE